MSMPVYNWMIVYSDNSTEIVQADNVADAELIERKLKLIREYTDKIPKFYTFCGFDRNDKWDENFWKQADGVSSLSCTKVDYKNISTLSICDHVIQKRFFLYSAALK